MRLLPRSLTGRLLVTASGTLLLGIALSAFVIAGVLGQFVLQTLDVRLDTEIALIARTLDHNPADPADTLRLADLPPFNQPESGWVWQVSGPFGTIHSASLTGQTFTLPALSEDQPPPPQHPDRHDEAPFRTQETLSVQGHISNIRPMDGRDHDGRALHYRVATFGSGPSALTIITAAPRDIVERPLKGAMLPMIECVIAMISMMLLALAVQTRIGLRPLVRLRNRVADVRAGRLQRFSIQEPSELVPLVEELDALIEANEKAIAQARTHAANLAHGLKTPLAALQLELAEAPGDDGARLRLLAERMDRQIRHHLGRARATGGSATYAPILELRPHLDDLAAALSRIHAETPRQIQIDVAADLTVRCDPQDLDELLGNILDNAWRHAASRVQVRAVSATRWVHITIEDDGHGLSDDEIRLVTQEGRRLDEQSPGIGFGLAITRDLCVLHGGHISLSRASIGGLCVTMVLPKG